MKLIGELCSLALLGLGYAAPIALLLIFIFPFVYNSQSAKTTGQRFGALGAGLLAVLVGAFPTFYLLMAILGTGVQYLADHDTTGGSDGTGLAWAILGMGAGVTVAALAGLWVQQRMLRTAR